MDLSCPFCSSECSFQEPFSFCSNLDWLLSPVAQLSLQDFSPPLSSLFLVPLPVLEPLPPGPHISSLHGFLLCLGKLKLTKLRGFHGAWDITFWIPFISENIFILPSSMIDSLGIESIFYQTNSRILWKLVTCITPGANSISARLQLENRNHSICFKEII